MRKNLGTFTFDAIRPIALVVAVVVLVWRVTRQAEPAAAPPPPRAARTPWVAVNGHIAPSVLTNVQGRARVAIVEFTDYECSFCGRYHATSFRLSGVS